MKTTKSRRASPRQNRNPRLGAERLEERTLMAGGLDLHTFARFGGALPRARELDPIPAQIRPSGLLRRGRGPRSKAPAQTLASVKNDATGTSSPPGHWPRTWHSRSGSRRCAPGQVGPSPRPPGRGPARPARSPGGRPHRRGHGLERDHAEDGGAEQPTRPGALRRHRAARRLRGGQRDRRGLRALPRDDRRTSRSLAGRRGRRRRPSRPGGPVPGRAP